MNVERLNSDSIKVLGLIMMTFDHLKAFIPDVFPFWFGWIGRPVATIFVYLIVVGYRHTNSKIKYARNMLLGFWGMNIINYALGRYFPIENVEPYANIFQTLFYCIYYLWVFDFFKKTIIAKTSFLEWAKLIIFILSPILISLLIVNNIETTTGLVLYEVIPNCIYTEGGFFLIIMAILFQGFYENKFSKYIIIVIFSLYTLWIAYTNNQNIFTEQYEWMVVFAIIPIAMYNYRKGKLNKYFFYIYYPLHILIIYLIGYISS